MKMLNHSREIAVIQFSRNQLFLFHSALSKLLEMQVDERELATVMNLSRTQINQLKSRIKKIKSSGKEFEEESIISLSYEDLEGLRGLMVEIASQAYFPKFNQFSEADLWEIEKIAEFIALSVMSKMDEGTILKSKNNKHARVCQELGIKKIQLKSNFDFSRIEKECSITVGESRLFFYLKGTNRKNFCQTMISIITPRKRIKSKHFNIQINHLARVISHLEFFSELNISNNEIENFSTLSLPNDRRENVLEINVFPAQQIEVKSVDILFNFNPCFFDTNLDCFEFNGKLKIKEIFQFTLSIRDFFSLICNS